MRKKLIIAALSSFIIFSCSKKKGTGLSGIQDGQNYPVDVIKMYDYDIVREYDELISHPVKYIKLESIEESVIGSVNKLACFDGKFFLLDIRNAKSAFIFDETGEFLAKINDVGKGHGKFVLPFDFDLNREDSLIEILDVNQRKILSYDFSGNFVGEDKIFEQVQTFFRINKDRYLFQIDGRDFVGQGKLPLVHISDRTHQNITHRGVYDYGVTDYAYIQKPYSRYDNNILLIHAFTDTLYTIKNNSFMPRYLIDFGERKLTDEVKSKPARELRQELENPKYDYHWGNIMESSKYVSFTWQRPKEDAMGRADASIFTLYYDKLNGNGISVSEKATLEGIPLTPPKLVNDDYFVSILYPHQLSELKDKKVPKDPVLKELYDELLSEHDMENPYLIFYKITLD